MLWIETLLPQCSCPSHDFVGSRRLLDLQDTRFVAEQHSGEPGVFRDGARTDKATAALRAASDSRL